MLAIRPMKYLSADFGILSAPERPERNGLPFLPERKYGAVVIHLDNEANRDDDLISIALPLAEAIDLRDQLDDLIVLGEGVDVDDPADDRPTEPGLGDESGPPPSSGLGRALVRACLILWACIRHPLRPSVLIEDENGIRIEHR